MTKIKPQPIVVDTTQSAYAQLKPVPLTAVTLTDEFWAARRAKNRTVALTAQYQQLEDTGRLDNFRRAAGKISQPFQGLYFNDSDVYKWVEAVAWTLATEPADAELAALLDGVIADIAAAQQPDGYLNTYYMFELEAERWSNLKDKHELYCAGHLFQAAIAHYRATGKDTLLTVACRFADLIDATFGSEEGKRQGVPGHSEIEMALVELARATGAARYLALAQYFVDARGQGLIGGRVYHQDHVPFREMHKLVGHAVRAVYLSAGATDLYAETGEAALGEILARQWGHMMSKQVYVTGGLGARYAGEAFGEDYELPNARAYAETCAGIANVMWAWRMLQLRGDAVYADLMERALYNAVLPGLSVDGTEYFYRNPLASGPDYHRKPWFTCACCPPNLARTLATLPGYLYSVSENTVWVHLYAANDAHLTLPNGRKVHIVQRTRYPWDGNITLEVLTAGAFAVRVRIPGWCADDEVAVLVNGEPLRGGIQAGAYITVERQWEPGDSVCLRLPMTPRRVVAHPYVLENTGRIALMRGPLLYCLESVDNADVDLRDVRLPAASVLGEEFYPGLMGGVSILRAAAEVVPPDVGWAGRLYRTARPVTPDARPVTLTAVPYHVWANRAPGDMLVWIKS